MRVALGPISAAGVHMGAVLSRLRSVDINWPYVSQGFVNGTSLFVGLPFLLALLNRRRLDSATWRTGAAAGAFVGGFRLLRQAK